MYSLLEGKKLVVFSVGASPATEKALLDIRTHNFDQALKEKAYHYHLRGAFHYAKLNAVDKILMSRLKKKLQKKDPPTLTFDEKGMLESYDRLHDWTDRASLRPIIDAIKNDGLTKPV